jgi:hypothetical protein
MSRSVHKTVKGVFGGKTESEIDDLIQSEDEDVLELARKYEYKRRARDQRSEQKHAPDLDRTATSEIEPAPEIASEWLAVLRCS